MIKKSYLSILSVIISISIFSQEFEKPKEVDEDLKESFLIQKNKITEMFNRFNKYN